MGTSLVLLLLAYAVLLVTLIWLVVAAFRIRVFYGFAVLFLPFSGLIFAIRYRKEIGGLYAVHLASYGAICLIVGSSPQLMAGMGHKIPGARLVAHALGTVEAPPARRLVGRGGSPTTAHEARDLAENESAPAPAPTVDPFAAPRAALARHNADLAAEFARLSAERAALKPGSGAALKVFNAKAARYQGGLQALQAEQAQLDALDHPGSVAVQASASPRPGAGDAGAEAEAGAALGRMRASVAEGNYAGFAATLRKCLADYRHTAAFAQIAAYAREVMRDTPPAKLSTALQQQAKAAQAEFDATTRQVQAIVNQTPPTALPPQGSTEVYWYNFDPGAIKPDFNVADVVTGREAWSGDFVYMKTRPGVFYRAADCEFNPQTKFFFTDRNVPKKKLTDAENREIVRLYRILGKDETIINTLTQRLARVDQTSTELVALNTQLRNAK